MAAPERVSEILTDFGQLGDLLAELDPEIEHHAVLTRHNVVRVTRTVQVERRAGRHRWIEERTETVYRTQPAPHPYCYCQDLMPGEDACRYTPHYDGCTSRDHDPTHTHRHTDACGAWLYPHTQEAHTA